jgi:hypothetical protein
VARHPDPPPPGPSHISLGCAAALNYKSHIQLNKNHGKKTEKFGEIPEDNVANLSTIIFKNQLQDSNTCNNLPHPSQ